jgi:hypothetical protein
MPPLRLRPEQERQAERGERLVPPVSVIPTLNERFARALSRLLVDGHRRGGRTDVLRTGTNRERTAIASFSTFARAERYGMNEPHALRRWIRALMNELHPAADTYLDEGGVLRDIASHEPRIRDGAETIDAYLTARDGRARATGLFDAFVRREEARDAALREFEERARRDTERALAEAPAPSVPASGGSWERSLHDDFLPPEDRTLAGRIRLLREKGGTFAWTADRLEKWFGGSETSKETIDTKKAA